MIICCEREVDQTSAEFYRLKLISMSSNQIKLTLDNCNVPPSSAYVTGMAFLM